MFQVNASIRKKVGNYTARVKTIPESHGSKPIVSSSAHRWNNILVESFRYAQSESPETSYSSNSVLIQTGGAKTISWCDGNGKRREDCYLPGEIAVFPEGFAHAGHSAASEFTAIHLEKEFIEAATRDFRAGNQINLLPQHRLRDDFIRSLGEHLLIEAASALPASRLFAESLATALAVHLVRNYSDEKSFVPHYRGGLAPRKLKKALEFIKEHLDEDLSLQDIAEEVGMSPYHFARGLKNEIGLAPHQYIIEQRIIKAKELLTGTNLPIVEIALQVGYNTQSHFTAVFHRHTGVTPKNYRFN